MYVCLSTRSSIIPSHLRGVRIAHGALLILPQAEWDAELDALLSDLTPPDGANAGRVDLYVREDAVHYASW